MTNPFAVGRISPDSEREYLRVCEGILGKVVASESPDGADAVVASFVTPNPTPFTPAGIEAAIRELNSLRELNAMAGIEVLGIRLGDLTRRVRELELRQEV